MNYIIVLIITLWGLFFTFETITIKYNIDQNHKETLSQIQKQIDAISKYNKALEECLREG